MIHIRIKFIFICLSLFVAACSSLADDSCTPVKLFNEKATGSPISLDIKTSKIREHIRLIHGAEPPTEGEDFFVRIFTPLKSGADIVGSVEDIWILPNMDEVESESVERCESVIGEEGSVVCGFPLTKFTSIAVYFNSANEVNADYGAGAKIIVDELKRDLFCH